MVARQLLRGSEAHLQGVGAGRVAPAAHRHEVGARGNPSLQAEVQRVAAVVVLGHPRAILGRKTSHRVRLASGFHTQNAFHRHVDAEHVRIASVVQLAASRGTQAHHARGILRIAVVVGLGGLGLERKLQDVAAGGLLVRAAHMHKVAAAGDGRFDREVAVFAAVLVGEQPPAPLVVATGNRTACVRKARGSCAQDAPRQIDAKEISVSPLFEFASCCGRHRHRGCRGFDVAVVVGDGGREPGVQRVGLIHYALR